MRAAPTAVALHHSRCKLQNAMKSLFTRSRQLHWVREGDIPFNKVLYYILQVVGTTMWDIVGNDVIHCMLVGCDSFIPFSIPYQKKRGLKDDLNNIKTRSWPTKWIYMNGVQVVCCKSQVKTCIYLWLLLTIGAHLENRFGADGQNHRVVKGGRTVRVTRLSYSAHFPPPRDLNCFQKKTITFP